MQQPFDSVTNLSAVIIEVKGLIAEGVVSEYAIGGAVAAILHNEPISTIDVDIFFLFAESQTGLLISLEKIYEFAKRRGFPFDSEFIRIHGWPVQFVEASHDPLWTEAIATAKPKLLDGVAVNLIDIVHLLAMWIQAGRKKDIRKIEIFDEAGLINSSELRDLLKRFGLLDRWKSFQHNFSDASRF